MNLIATVKAFFKTPRIDPATEAAIRAFSEASDDYNLAFQAIEPFSTCANHRFTLRIGAARVLSANSDEFDNACTAYDEAVGAYTNPADHEPYCEAYLDAHTAAMNHLSKAFNGIMSTFNAFNPTDEPYPHAADLFKAICDTYTCAADAYTNAASCALSTALEGHVKAAKDNWECYLLDLRAANPGNTNPAVAKSKADAFRVKSGEDAAKMTALEQKAKLAGAMAEVFIAEAKSAANNAEKALESNKKAELRHMPKMTDEPRHP